jgi:hypothetical protein
VSDEARRDAFEDDVRTALFRPTGELKRLQFRLMGFATGLALVVLLAPAWLTNGTESGRSSRMYSGMGLIGLTPGAEPPMGALGTVLFLGYLLLALALLVLPTETPYALSAGIAGLVVTFVIVVNQPEARGSQVVHSTGAPAVALGIWLLAIILAGIARATTRS